MLKKILLTTSTCLMLIIGFSSCNVGSQTNYSPRLTFLNPATLNSDSTVKMSYTTDGNIQFDSLHVNDTVLLQVVSEGYTNNLKNFNITVADSTDLKIILNDSITSLFDAKSDFKHGKFVFPNNIVFLNYPFKFITLKPKDKVKVNFYLNSDATGVTNETQMQLEFPVKPKR